MELGVWIGPGNELGTPIGVADAANHVAGFCLLNDWSARDIQGWEYQPLGPFSARASARPSRRGSSPPKHWRRSEPSSRHGPQATRRPCPTSSTRATSQPAGSPSISKSFCSRQVWSRRGFRAYRLSSTSARHLYWTIAQLVAHHTSGGCNLRPGDLLGTGTISGPGEDQLGSLLEISAGGRRPVELASGESRRFLEDGDTVIMQARCKRDGFTTIGFGECRGTIQPAS